MLDASAIALLNPAAPGQSPLGPQASYTRNVSVVIPADIATGSYFLLFVANANGGQYESDNGNDTNDLVADPITLTAPDLQVTSVSGPASGYHQPECPGHLDRYQQWDRHGDWALGGQRLCRDGCPGRQPDAAGLL